MLLREAFPRAAAALPRRIRWDAEFDWSGDMPTAVADLLITVLDEAQRVSCAKMLALAELIRCDLTAETQRIGSGAGAPLIDGARFAVAIPAITATMTMGLYGDCYGWVHWSASRSHDPTRRVNVGEYRLPPFEGATHNMNELCLACLIVWITYAYMLARKLGGMDTWCGNIFGYVVNRSVESLEAGHVTAGVEALVAIVNWATERDHPSAERITRTLRNVYENPGLPDRAKVLLGILFSTAAARWTGQTPQWWAQRTLDEVRHALVEHESVQLLAVAVGSRDQWTACRDEILREIRELAACYRSTALGFATTVALEARVAIIQPLIFNLVEFGTTGDLMDVLWAWYGRGGEQCADSNILFVASAHARGVTYLWPTGRVILQNAVLAETLERMLEAVSDSLNEYFRGPMGDRELHLNERMVGAPHFPNAPELIAAMHAHYCFERLADALPKDWRPRSIVVFPAHRDPLQAQLHASLGWLAPIEASLSRAAPDRPIRRISIWPGETQTTAAEISTIEVIARGTGWITTVTTGPLDARAFKAFYEDPTADVLWVIGHGEQSPFRPEDTGLVVANEALLNIPTLSTFEEPRHGRRLLVLNICSSGATQNKGGLARVGFAHGLVSPHQAVVGHLWPIDYYAALAFGCLFTANLVHLSPAEALAATQDLMKDHDQLLDALSAISPSLEALDWLRSERAAEQLGNVLSWGSAVLLT